MTVVDLQVAVVFLVIEDQEDPTIDIGIDAGAEEEARKPNNRL